MDRHATWHSIGSFEDHVHRVVSFGLEIEDASVMRRIVVADPVVAVQGDAFDFDRSDAVTAYSIGPGRRLFAGVVLAIPLDDQAIEPDDEILLRTFADQGTDE